MVALAPRQIAFASATLLLGLPNIALADFHVVRDCADRLWVESVWIVGNPPASETTELGALVFASTFEIQEEGYVLVGFGTPRALWEGCLYVPTYWRDPTLTPPLPSTPTFEISFAEFRDTYDWRVEDLPGDDWRLWQFDDLPEGWHVVDIDHNFSALRM